MDSNKFTMCCIFNCMQYFLAFLHKFVTAVFCCMLAYAICFVMMFAVVAGVALGYNYSVSEFLEHKDTNVSVQLVRGVFPEDEMDDDMRRAGGGKAGPDMRDSGALESSDLLKTRLNQLESGESYERKLQEITSLKYEEDIFENEDHDEKDIPAINITKQTLENNLLLHDLINTLKKVAPSIVDSNEKDNKIEEQGKTISFTTADSIEGDLPVGRNGNEKENKTNNLTETTIQIHSKTPTRTERPFKKRADSSDSSLKNNLRQLLRDAEKRLRAEDRNVVTKNEEFNEREMKALHLPAGSLEIVKMYESDRDKSAASSSAPGDEFDDMDEERPQHYRPVRRRRRHALAYHNNTSHALF